MAFRVDEEHTLPDGGRVQDKIRHRRGPRGVTARMGRLLSQAGAVLEMCHEMVAPDGTILHRPEIEILRQESQL
jgi:hypothetical protein